MDLADVLIHVHADLPSDERAKLEEDLRGCPGMVSVHFSAEHPHLLTVIYDPQATSSAAILEHVGERGVEATRIGL